MTKRQQSEKEHKNRKKPNIVTIIVAIGIVVSMFFYFFTFQVRMMEQAVVTTFRSPKTIIREPGLYWKWPYPFQDVHKYDTRLRVLDMGRLEQVITQDKKSVILSTYIAWKVTDPGKFLVRIGDDVGEVTDYLQNLIQSHTNGVLNKHPFSHLISHRREELQFDAIEEEIRQLINDHEGGAASIGITVEEFGINRLVLSETASREVFNRMREERNGEADKYRSEGEGESQAIRSEAEALKEKILIEAQAEAKKIRGQGVAAAAKFYKTFAEEHQLALWIRKLEALERILNGGPATLIVGPETKPFDLLRDGYDPLLDNTAQQNEDEPETTADSWWFGNIDEEKGE